MPDDTQEDPVAKDGDDDTTTSTSTRWTYIGTVLAAIMVISLPVLIIGTAIGALTFSGIGQAWFGLYFTVTLMAAVWAFGKETLETVQKVRGGGK